MLKDILQRINQEGYLSASNLARQLDTSASAVEAGVEQLVRMGYLVRDVTGRDCTVVCAGCPYAVSCSKDILTSYKITGKGESLLQS